MRVVAPAGLIADRYRLLSPLGSGASATVWAAADETLGRKVALKLLTSRAAADSDEREQLWREGRALAALTHPHIIVVFDFLEAPGLDGAVQPVLITELLEGRSLASLLAERRLHWRKALSVCGQLASALAAAHQAGIVHRDVTPANVMLTSSGIKLLDFGIAAATHEGASDDGMTVGTPVCMAPEQLIGHAAVPASDVYALGCVLHWCLTGRPPYRDRDITWLTQSHLRAAPPPLTIAGLPEGINELYLACLEKDPDDRPTAEQMAEVLAPYAPKAASASESAAAAATAAMAVSETGTEPEPVPAVGAGAESAVAPTILAAALVAAEPATDGQSPADDATQALPVLTSTGAVVVTTYTSSSSAAEADVGRAKTNGAPPRAPTRHAGHGRGINRRRLLPVGLLLAALGVIALMIVGLSKEMFGRGTSATGNKGVPTQSAVPATGTSAAATATVPSVTLPSGSAVPSMSAGAHQSGRPAASASGLASASPSASAPLTVPSQAPPPTTATSAAAAFPPLPDPAGNAVGYLQALANQVQAMVSQGPGTLEANAGQNLVKSIGALQNAVVAAQQNNGKKAWRNVANDIASLQQQIANDQTAGLISTSAANLLSNEVQRLADSLNTTSSQNGG